MNKLLNFYLILPKKLKKNFYALIILMVFLGFLEIMSIGAVVPVIGVMLDENFVNENEILNSIFIFFGLNNFSNYIFLTLIILASIYIIKSIFVIILTYKKNRLIFDTRVNLSTKLLQFYIRQDYEEYTRRGSYVLINNILKEVPYLVDGVFTPIITIIIEFITFIFIFFLLISYEPVGTLAIFLFFLLYGLTYYLFFTNKAKIHGKIRAKSLEKSSAQIIQSINGLKEIKLYLKENFFIKRFDADLSRASNAETFAKFSMDGAKGLAEAAIEAAKIGGSLETILTSADKLLNFEESLTAQFKAQVLTGKQLNLERARQLSLEGDIAGFTEEIQSVIGGLGDLQALNVVQRQAVADAIGISVRELQRIAAGEQAQERETVQDKLDVSNGFLREIAGYTSETAAKDNSVEVIQPVF